MKTNPWPESASELYRPSDHRFPAKLVPIFADRGCHVVSVTNPYGRIFGFIERSSNFFFQVVPQLNSRAEWTPRYMKIYISKLWRIMSKLTALPKRIFQQKSQVFTTNFPRRCLHVQLSQTMSTCSTFPDSVFTTNFPRRCLHVQLSLTMSTCSTFPDSVFTTNFPRQCLHVQLSHPSWGSPFPFCLFIRRVVFCPLE
jgi:hypothetical protein